MNPNTKFNINVDQEKSIMLFLLSGDAKVADEKVIEKSAVKLSEGTSIEIESLDERIEILFINSDPLGESISWGGPIVMNSREEIELAFKELRNGDFLKNRVEY